MQELDALVLRRRHAPVFREPVQRPAVRHLYGLRGAVVDNDELGAGWQLTLERLDGGSEEVRSVQRGDADADVRGLLGVVVPRWCRQVGLRDVADSVDHDLGHWRTSMNRQCAESEGLEPPRAFAPAAFSPTGACAKVGCSCPRTCRSANGSWGTAVSCWRGRRAPCCRRCGRPERSAAAHSLPAGFRRWRTDRRPAQSAPVGRALCSSLDSRVAGRCKWTLCAPYWSTKRSSTCAEIDDRASEKTRHTASRSRSAAHREPACSRPPSSTTSLAAPSAPASRSTARRSGGRWCLAPAWSSPFLCSLVLDQPGTLQWRARRAGSTQRERWQHLAGTGRARQKRRPESGEEDALKGRRCAARGAVPAPAQRVFQDSSIACSSSLRWEIAPFLLATGESHTPWRASSLTSRRSGLLSRKAIAIRLRISSTPRLLRRAVRTRFTNSRRATGPSRRAFAKALAMNSCPRGEASAFRMTSSRSFLVA